MNTVYRAIASKLDPIDSIRLSTLSKETQRSIDPPTKLDDILFVRAEDEIAFTKWIGKYGASVRDVSLEDMYALTTTCVESVVEGCPLLRRFECKLPMVNASALSRCCHLEDISIDLGLVTNVSVSLERLTLPTLKNLHVKYGDKKFVHLPARMLSLESLIIVDCSLASLPVMPCIGALEIIGCVVYSEGLGSMAPLTTLKELTLADCTLFRAPVELENLVNLQRLDLSGNNRNRLITTGENADFYEDMLAAVQPLAALTSLDVSYSRLDTAGMQCLSMLTCSNLCWLDVSHNPCTDLPSGAYTTNLKYLITSCIPSCLRDMKSMNMMCLRGHCIENAPPDEDTWPDVDLISVPPSLDFIYLDGLISSRLVLGMLTLMSKTPRLSAHRLAA